MGNLAILARISPIIERLKAPKKRGQTTISQSLDVRLISFLEVESRDEAIDALIDLFDKAGKLPDKALFRQAIFHREKLVSTGIGVSVAVPHAKLKSFTDFCIAVGIQRKKGIEWNALDMAPVRIIFMIGGPEDRQSEYLQILSQLTSAIKNVDLRKALLKAQSPEQVLDLFAEV